MFRPRRDRADRVGAGQFAHQLRRDICGCVAMDWSISVLTRAGIPDGQTIAKATAINLAPVWYDIRWSLFAKKRGSA